MEITGFVVLLTLIGYVCAQGCGCLKCSDHLRVIGKTVPIGDCPPTTIIYSNSHNCNTGKTLSFKIEKPVPAVLKEEPEDLTFKVVQQVSCVKKEKPAKYNMKIELPVPAAVSAPPSASLKPCIDRMIISYPSTGCEKEVFPVCPATVPSDTVYINPTECVDSITKFDEEIFINPINVPAPTHTGQFCTYPVNVNPIKNTVCVNPINPTSIQVQHPFRLPSDPVLDYSLLKEILARYRNHLKDKLGCSRCNCLGLKNRSKRDVPFLTPGYKFVMSMLPEFLQEPIKNTVNVLALTHPDERLKRVYKQPRKFTLKEKLQMQKKKNIDMLKNKIRNIKYNKTPYNDDNSSYRDYSRYYPDLYNTPSYSNYQRPRKLSPRSKFLDENNERGKILDDDYYEAPRNVYNEYPFKFESKDLTATKGNSEKLKKSIMWKKLWHSNKGNRNKRGSVYEHRPFPRSLKQHKQPTFFDSSEFVLPFYQVKEKHLNDDYKYDDGYENSWNEHIKSFPTDYFKSFRYRREGDEYNLEKPCRFSEVDKENLNIKEAYLRNVIRDELKQYQFQNEEEPQDLLGTANKIPHSPILHIITFPIRLLQKFNDITKEVFPTVESVPAIVKGTKRYFKDFGKNLKKNFLHLTSDVIGDFENLELTDNLLGPIRERRSSSLSNNPILKLFRPDKFQPQYSVPSSDGIDDKLRTKRYILKKVDENEIEEYLMEKLSSIFGDHEPTLTKANRPLKTSHYYRENQNYYNRDDGSNKELVLEQIKPKIIIDNNGKSFLEVNGYKRPLMSTSRKSLLKLPNRFTRKQLKPSKLLGKLRYYDSSEEADTERIDSLIGHARDHLERTENLEYSEIPINMIKQKISQLLFETDVLVHLDFEKYDEIYDDLIALQQVKNSIVQDWKRLIISKAINEISAKVELLERFKELQYYKDITLANVVSFLYEDCENMFIAKKLIKMLVRLQKLQCVINQVVANFKDHLHISSKSEIAKEIKYVDFMNSLKFANEKSRNNMIANLAKDRDVALQKNIILLDKLKKLLMDETEDYKIEKEAKLLWEMKNIEKMQRDIIDEMKAKFEAGYKITKELKIIFDLLRRYENCESNQRKLLSKFDDGNGKDTEEEESEEVSDEGSLLNAKKTVKTKLDWQELKTKWQEKLNQQRALLRKQLKKNMRKLKKSDEDD